jgi:hypothetical protein
MEKEGQGMRCLLIPALVLLTSTTLSAQDPNYVLGVGSATGPEGTQTIVSCTLDNTGDPVAGYTLAVCNDPDIALAVAVVSGTATETVNNGGPPDFHAVNIINYTDPAGFTVGVIFSLLGQTALAPGLELELEVATYDLIAPGATSLEYCFNFGYLGVPSLVTVNGAVDPSFANGLLTVTDQLITRGDTNDDGDVSLSDAIFALQMMFISDDVLPCQAAADVDASGSVTLADPINLLSYLFNGGLPPAAPYPSCGPLETGFMDCQVYLSCP